MVPKFRHFHQASEGKFGETWGIGPGTSDTIGQAFH